MQSAETVLGVLRERGERGLPCEELYRQLWNPQLFGGIPLKRQKGATINDRAPGRVIYPRKELVTRLLRGRCEMCEQTGEMVVHHVRRLADLDPPGPTQPEWAALMAKMQRKTLVVCLPCHEHIHQGHHTAAATA